MRRAQTANRIVLTAVRQPLLPIVALIVVRDVAPSGFSLIAYDRRRRRWHDGHCANLAAGAHTVMIGAPGITCPWKLYRRCQFFGHTQPRLGPGDPVLLYC